MQKIRHACQRTGLMAFLSRCLVHFCNLKQEHLEELESARLDPLTARSLLNDDSDNEEESMDIPINSVFQSTTPKTLVPRMNSLLLKSASLPRNSRILSTPLKVDSHIGTTLQIPSISECRDDENNEVKLNTRVPGPPVNKLQLPDSVSTFRNLETTIPKCAKNVVEPKLDVAAMFSHSRLNTSLITLMLGLLVAPDESTLDPAYSGQYPLTDSVVGINILHYLHIHVNEYVEKVDLTKVYDKIQKNFGGGVVRLWRLLTVPLFNKAQYCMLNPIGRGGFGAVYQCEPSVPLAPIDNYAKNLLAIKLVDRPIVAEKRCVVHDLFHEVSIFEMLRGTHCTAQLFDYGVTNDNYCMVMECGHSSLSDWRKLTLQENYSMLGLIYVFKEVQLATLLE